MKLQRHCLSASLAAVLFVSVGDAGAAARMESTGRVSAARELEPAISSVYPALVRIHVVSETGEDGRMRKGRSSGSGTIITKDGYILTNHHVAGRATRIVCRLSNREEVDATLVGTDPLSDLAIIKLDLSSRRDPKAPLAVAKFGDSDKLKVGDVVLAMGSPSGLSQSVTRGIVANTAMIMPNGEFMLDGENVGELVRWIGHDAVIYHGNSGGPLVNLKGEIVGVNEIGIATMGGAIPGNLAQSMAKELIAKGFIERSWIGVEVQPLLKQMAGDKGILVSAVLNDSPAKAAGLESGDIITDVNGVGVAESRSPEDVPVFNQLLLSTPVGSRMTLKGLRAGQSQTWQLTTASRERNQGLEREVAEWGVTVRDLTRLAALENRWPDKRGVLIDSVRLGGACAESKPALKKDDRIIRVNGREIADTDALIEFTKDFTRGISNAQPALVNFERDSLNLATVVKIGPESANDSPRRAARPWLGAETQVLTDDLALALNLEGQKGVRVTRVSPDSPANHAGLRDGDVLLKLDGQVIAARAISDEELFANLVRTYKAGSEIELAGVRDGAPFSLKVKLAEHPDPTTNLAELKDDQFQFKARDLAYSDRVEEDLPSDAKGVRIVNVERAGWASLGGLGSGDILISVEGKPINNIAGLKAILAQVGESKPRRVAFFVKRGIHTKYLELEPRW